MNCVQVFYIYAVYSSWWRLVEAKTLTANITLTPVRKLKTPITSKQGKRLLFLATTWTWNIMKELGSWELYIPGHHIYKEKWDPVIGEVVQCEREPRNAADRYSVAVTRGAVVVGHLPQRISRLCSLFLRWGGTIDCVTTGARRYSLDLPLGGLEVSCSLLVKAELKEIEKFKKLWKK